MWVLTAREEGSQDTAELDERLAAKTDDASADLLDAAEELLDQGGELAEVPILDVSESKDVKRRCRLTTEGITLISSEMLQMRPSTS